MRKLATGGLLVAFLMACPQISAVWVIPGSTSSDLRFGIGRERDEPGTLVVSVFRVDACGDSTEGGAARRLMWGAGFARNTTFEQRELTEIRYGQMPAGFEPLIGQADTALTLTPGCYRASVGGTGRTQFDVTSDGSIIERSTD